MTRICTQCDIEKDFSNYYSKKSGKYGKESICKSCCIKRSNKDYKENREERLISMRKYNKLNREQNRLRSQDWYYNNKDKARNGQLLRKYGITHDQYTELLNKQNGVCRICFKFQLEKGYSYMNVDHDHKTGNNRSILCTWCNTGLGLFKDNPDIVRSALRYLENYGN